MRASPLTIRRVGPTLLLVSALAFPAGELRTISVHVSNSYGDPASTASITITGNGLSLTASPDQVLTVPYGRYTVKVNVPGFENATEVFTVDQAQQVLPVAMELGRMEDNIPTSCSIRGSVVPSATVTRVRLVQLFGTYSVDVPINKGAFEFHDLKCGDYMLVAMGMKECVASRMARASPVATGSDIHLDSDSGGACSATR
jgi:PEGA domain